MNDLTVEKIFEMVCPALKHTKCDHKKEGQYTYWKADSGLCWCNKCGMCLNGRYEWDNNFVVSGY